MDWYDYGARFYDASLGRWHVQDPRAEKYSFQSPYCYAANNPVKYVDKDGKEPELALLYFVPGVGEALLVATAVVAVSYVAYKGAEATYNAVSDAREGYKEQQRREGKSQQETNKIKQNHAENMKPIMPTQRPMEMEECLKEEGVPLARLLWELD